MPTLTNEQEIKRWLQPKIEIIVQEILNGIEEWNEKEITRVVYNAGTPHEYVRVNSEEDFLHAWDGKIVDSSVEEVTGEFKYAPEKMSNILDAQHIGQHNSIVTGEDIRPYLAEIIYEGKAGDIFPSRGFWNEKRDAWSALLKIAKVDGAKMKTWINRGAKRAGIKIEW